MRKKYDPFDIYSDSEYVLNIGLQLFPITYLTLTTK